ATPRDSFERAGLNLREYTVSLTNYHNDRIYLATPSGSLLCLREPGQVNPYELRDPKQPRFGILPEASEPPAGQPPARPPGAAAGRRGRAPGGRAGRPGPRARPSPPRAACPPPAATRPSKVARRASEGLALSRGEPSLTISSRSPVSSREPGFCVFTLGELL